MSVSGPWPGTIVDVHGLDALAGGDRLDHRRDHFNAQLAGEVTEARAELAHAQREARDLAELGHQRRRDLGHLGGAATRGDDLGVAHQRVTPTVIAVGVGVDDGADRRGRGHCGAHGCEHLRGQARVEQRVDQHADLALIRPALLRPQEPLGCMYAQQPSPTSRKPGS